MYYIHIGVFKKLNLEVLFLLKVLPFSLWSLLQSTRDLFLCTICRRYAFYFFSCGMMMFLHHLLNCISFLHVSSMPSCDKSPYMLRNISKHSVPFSWPISHSQCQYLTILLLHQKCDICKTSPPSELFFWSILVIPSPLCSHMNCRISSSGSIKYSFWCFQ